MQNSQCGSQWRKWDLHIHTPYSIVATEYEKNTPEDKIWDNFIDQLEKITEEKDIKVIGINDYWVLEGYKKVKEYRDKGRLQNIDAILPLVEYRINTHVGKNVKVNMHILFDDIGYDELHEQWIARFLTEKFEIDGRKKPLTYENIVAYHKNGISFENIHKNLVFDPDTITILLADSSINYLQGFGVSEVSNIDTEAFPTVFNSFVNKADFFFLASGGTADKTISEAIAKNQIYYNDAAILHCSDTHNYPKDSASTTPKDMGHCWTWIKGEASFHGLKFALEDYKSRIKIQETSPLFDITPPYLESICFPEPFKIEEGREVNLPSTIYFNRYMTSIIGGRGSGKTTLLEAISTGISVFNTDVIFSMKEGDSNSLRNAVLYLGKEKLKDTLNLKEYLTIHSPTIPTLLEFKPEKLQLLSNSKQNKEKLISEIDVSRKLINSYQAQSMHDMLISYNSVLDNITNYDKLAQELKKILDHCNVLKVINSKISSVNQNILLESKLSFLEYKLLSEIEIAIKSVEEKKLELGDLKNKKKIELENAFPDKNIKSITDAIQLEANKIKKCEYMKWQIESVEGEFENYDTVLSEYILSYIKYFQDNLCEHEKSWENLKKNHMYTKLLKGVTVKSFIN